MPNLYLGLSATSHITNVLHYCTLPDKLCLSHGRCLYQAMMTLHFLNNVANDAELIQIENYAIIASLKSETMGKLINRIPGSRRSISKYQARL